MTAPGPGGPARPTTEGNAGPASFSEAEKLMAEWEARHDVAARGGRPGAVTVGQYLMHTRCEDARTHKDTEHVPHRQPRRPAPPDARPHVSDLLAWIVTPSTTRHDEPTERRDKPAG
jgi:hypothetical protein